MKKIERNAVSMQIKLARVAKCWNQKELAYMSDISLPTVVRIEKDVNTCTFISIVKVCKVLNINPQIVQEQNEEKKE